MKKFLLGALLITGLCCGVVNAALEDDLKYLGYSDTTTHFAQENMRQEKKVTPAPQPKPQAQSNTALDEANSVTEQLTELGRTRAFTPDMVDRSQETKSKLDQYWTTMKPGGTIPHTPLTPEFKDELKQRLSQAVVGAGYELKQLDLIDVENAPRVRAVIRAVRPVKTNDPYKEIQGYLLELKSLALGAGTIDGVTYLSEMTTFVAENPQNKYYYEKTILNP